MRCPQPRSDRVWEVDEVLQRHARRPARVHHPVAPPTPTRAASCSLVQPRVLSTCYTPLLHTPAGEVAGAGVEDVAEADAVVVAASRRHLAFDGGEALGHAGVGNLARGEGPRTRHHTHAHTHTLKGCVVLVPRPGRA